MSTQGFEQRALSAGASLRATFYEGNPMTAPITHRPPGVEQAHRRRAHGRSLVPAAAAAAVAVVAASVGLAATLQGDDPTVLPPARTGPVVPAGERLEVPGLSMPLPPSWQVSARTLRYVQAGNPADRSRDGINIIAPASVVAPDGTRTTTPADLVSWLQARPGITTQVLKAAVAVGTSQATLVRVDPSNGSQVLWCGSGPASSDMGSCFNTGTTTVLYLLVPTDSGPVVLERMVPDAADGLTGDDLQTWTEAHLDLAPDIELSN